jgi:hyperosmotically inducible periplasmic protein
MKGNIMNTPLRITTLLLATFVAFASTGCAVMRNQETVGAYVDDVGITTSVKARFVDDKTVDASAISVETLNGTVQLSGFAKSAAERAQAETIARAVAGVKVVRNNIIIKS